MPKIPPWLPPVITLTAAGTMLASIVLSIVRDLDATRFCTSPSFMFMLITELSLAFVGFGRHCPQSSPWLPSEYFFVKMSAFASLLAVCFLREESVMQNYGSYNLMGLSGFFPGIFSTILCFVNLLIAPHVGHQQQEQQQLQQSVVTTPRGRQRTLSILQCLLAAGATVGLILTALLPIGVCSYDCDQNNTQWPCLTSFAFGVRNDHTQSVDEDYHTSITAFTKGELRVLSFISLGLGCFANIILMFTVCVLSKSKPFTELLLSGSAFILSALACIFLWRYITTATLYDTLLPSSCSPSRAFAASIAATVYSITKCVLFFLFRKPARIAIYLEGVSPHQEASTPPQDTFELQVQDQTPAKTDFDSLEAIYGHVQLIKRPKEISRESVVLIERIGGGAFGDVYRGTVSSQALGEGSSSQKEVAIKMLSLSLSDKEKSNILLEANVMAQLEHQNLVSLVGVVTKVSPVLLVMELCANGCLLDYLKETSAIPYKQKLFIAREVCEGAQYLASRRLVHRDIAARNVLITDTWRFKLGDFGMARDVSQQADYIYSRSQGKIPVRWSSPEVLVSRAYSEHSDVWAFGILLYEIFTGGQRPYSLVGSNDEVVRRVSAGNFFPDKEPSIPEIVYAIMRTCWAPLSERTLFASLLADLRSVQSSGELTNTTAKRDKNHKDGGGDTQRHTHWDEPLPEPVDYYTRVDPDDAASRQDTTTSPVVYEQLDTIA